MRDRQPKGTEKPLRIRLIEAEVAGWPDWQQCFYELMVESGNHPVMAHMLACRQAPVMGQSDRSFCESLHRRMSGRSEQERTAMVELARRAGINTDGKFYVGGLGTYSDPTAWVSNIEDARRALELKPHLNAEGLVRKKATHIPDGPPPRKILADDLAAEMIHKEIAADPKLAEKVRKKQVSASELREMVEDKYAYKPTSIVPLSPLGEKIRARMRKRMKEKRAKAGVT
jgi:hypothetical protein